jgi:ribosome-associated protein
MSPLWEDDGGLRVTRDVVVPSRELHWRFSRSGGPGGQSVNTTDSRVELLLDVVTSEALDERQRARVAERLGERLTSGVLVVTASEHRSQLRNRDAAAARLAALLRDALAPPRRPRRPTRPTRGSQQRRLDAKSRRSQTKRLRRPPQE